MMRQMELAIAPVRHEQSERQTDQRLIQAVTDPADDKETIARYDFRDPNAEDPNKRIHVDEAGAVSAARVLRGLGSGLDQNALVALRQWRFRPGRRQGVPAAMDAEVDVEFNLRSEGVNELIANDMATLVGPDVTPPRVVRTSRVSLRGLDAQGLVVLDVVLQQDGSPRVVRILRSLGPEADERAVRHFEQWHFTPAMKGGVPVKVRMNAEVRFRG